MPQEGAVGEAAQQMSYAKRVLAFQDRQSWVDQAQRLISQSRVSTVSRVLDFGCGPGRFCRMLGHRVRSVVGVDTSSDMLRLAIKVPVVGVEYVQISPDDPLPFAGEFDTVFCLHVLGHVQKVEETVGQFRRALKPGGRVVVLNPNLTHTRLRRPINKLLGYEPDPTILRRFTLSEFTDIMASEGFTREWSYMTGDMFFGVRSLFAASFTRP